MKKTPLSFICVVFVIALFCSVQSWANEQSAKKEMIAAAAQAKSTSSVSELITILDTDPDGYTRSFAAWALGEIGDGAASSALSKALKDVDKGVRVEAEMALSKIN